MRSVLFVFLFVLFGSARGLDHRQLALVVNTLDPLSVAIGEYYAAKRAISFQNVVRVAFAPGKPSLSRPEFD